MRSAVASIGPSGDWEASTALASGRRIIDSDPAVAAGGGPAVAMWIEEDSSSYQFYWSLKEGDAAWSPATREWLFQTGYFTVRDLNVAATAGGAVAAWIRENNTNATLVIATLSYKDVSPPPLDIIGPADGFVSDSPTVTVRGRTEPGAQVTVGGAIAAVSPNGSFEVVVALPSGRHVLHIVATDPAGNSATRDLNMTYEAPLGSLAGFGLNAASLLAAAFFLAFLATAFQYRRAARREGPPPPQ